MHFSTLDEYSDYLVERKAENENINRAWDLLFSSDKNIGKVIGDNNLSPREYIEVIALRRREGYSQSAGNGNISADNQTDRMYGNTPWKFIEEFLQNADDCKYSENPEIQIIVNECVGTIEFAYNEEGFTRNDIWALTAHEQSTKSNENDSLLDIVEEGVFYREKTGRKGIGFKSVFSLPAENIRVHIRSNEYSFCLDKAIGRIIPIWEEESCADNRTHIVVELINPKFALDEIYPKFKDVFCVDDISLIFEKSPALFMHHLRNIHVVHVDDSGNKESFSILIDHDPAQLRYEEPFTPTGVVLAGIKHGAQYYRKAYSFMNINIQSSFLEDVEICCARETQMVDIDQKCRNISIIAPIITGTDNNSWKSGSLFRTFPMIDNRFSVPVSIDAPFELNSSRKGIEYTNLRGEMDFNNRIIDLVFGKDALFTDFFMFLRAIKDIQIDQYFSRKQNNAVLFANDANIDDNGRRLIPEIDLAGIIEKLPLFHLYDDQGFSSREEVTTVDPELFSWLDVGILFSDLFGGTRKVLASDKYLCSPILTFTDVTDLSFSESVNNYLSVLEDKYGIEDPQFLMFIESSLYPYLKKKQKRLIENGSYESLKVFLSSVKDSDGRKVLRETYKEGEWFYYNTENNLSFWKYRIVESSPVSLENVLDVLNYKRGVKRLEEVFGEEVISKSADQYSDWPSIKMFLMAASYYGFNTSDLKIEALKKYAVPAEVDKYTKNPFRTAGIVEVIPLEDIRELEKVYGGTEQFVSLLYKFGLRYYKAIGKPQKDKGVKLYEDSIQLLQSQVEDCSFQYAQLITNHLLKTSKHVFFNEEEFFLFPIETKLLFMRNKDCILIGDYRKICDAILNDEKSWEISSDAYAEMLIYAYKDANSTTLLSELRDKKVMVTMPYIVENNLLMVVQDILINKKWSQLRIINDGFFDEIPGSEVRTKVAILAPGKLDTLQNEKMHFYRGEMKDLPEEQHYLVDGSETEIFLHCNEEGLYDKSLSQYLHTSFDLTASKYMEEIRNQNQKVYLSYIKPALEQVDANLGETFKLVKNNFPDRTKEEYIQILSWFRMQSYSEALGNASASSEKEIERDYKDSPWNFIYEFIQNVDDCVYPSGKYPVLGIEIDEEGCSVTFTYNETGFTPADIEALTSFGSSTKDGKLEPIPKEDGLFDRERTGRMGRGFKSVFALPGKDIAVHIQSNGYSFRLRKRVGTIIPEWVPDDAMKEGTTKIRVEGFRKDKIGEIYNRLQKWFSVDNLEEFFAKCPLLYLRKLRRLVVINGVHSFSIEIFSKKCEYEGEFLVPQGAEIVSGILYQGQYWEKCRQIQRIDIKENGKQVIKVSILKETKMTVLGGKTRTVSCTAPIITESGGKNFSAGTIFRTLPLKGNTFGEIPLAINGPFITDDGRMKVRDDRLNQPAIDILSEDVIPSLYAHLRDIDGIKIENYIPGWSQYLFMGYKNLNGIDLKSIIREQPLLEMYYSKGYISPQKARVMPQEFYAWAFPEVLADSFLKEAERYLVGEQYVGKKFSISEINFIHSDFVDCLNKYVDEVEQRDPELLCKVLKEDILPYVTSHYDELLRVYRAEKTVDDLKKLRIFLFDMADGTMVLEAADSDTIWVSDFPDQYASYGKYRSISHSPVRYTPDQLKWMRELHTIRSFENAFQKEDFEAKRMGTWEEVSALIETLLYYDLDSQFKGKIPFLKRCLLDEKYDPSKNVFREAYIDNHSSNIAEYFIKDEDVLAIYGRISTVSPRPIEKIGEFIIKLGVRTGATLFDRSKDLKGALNCCDELLAVFKEYCRTKENATRVIGIVQEYLNEIHESKRMRLIIGYEDLISCTPEFMTCLFKSNLLDEMDMKWLAQEYYNADNEIADDNPEYVTSLVLAAALVDKPQGIVKERELSIGLSEIFKNKLGTSIQKIMRIHDAKIGLQIIEEQDYPITPYSGEAISKALSWLDDSKEEQSVIARAYNYFTADISNAFEDSVDQRTIYLIDSGKVLLNIFSTDASLLAFVRNQYKNKDAEFRTLIEIIHDQDLLRHWHGSKRQYVEMLAGFRKKTRSIEKILYPDYTESINNATGNAADYIIPELLQNINDCTCSIPNCMRHLRISIDNESGTMTLVYEEDGFDYSNVYSITAMGQSSKHDKREGEKGLGFKKVFSLFEKVEIFSNGFFFSLAKNAPTVPCWIPNVEKSVTNNGAITTMVFYTEDRKRLGRITNQWKGIFTTPYIETTASPLFLENIQRYSLTIDGTDYYTVLREDILDEYYLLKKPILETYESLFPENSSETEKQAVLEMIKGELKKRVKCEAMTEEEFQDYVGSISITIGFPKKIQKRISGCYYSTLPTLQSTASSLFINLPLELSTGRDGLLQDSAFNHCVMDLIYRKGDHAVSVYGLMLQEAAENLPEKEIFEYIKDDICEWLDQRSEGNPTTRSKLVEEVSNWNIFHSYPDNALVSLRNSYSVDSVIYQYLDSGIESKNDFLNWCQKYKQDISHWNMIYFKKNIVKTTEAMESFAANLEMRQEYYPISNRYNMIVYDYFCEEYEEDRKP